MGNTTHSSEQYAYQDQTKEPTDGITAKEAAMIDEASQAELNPAYYPRWNKPEALHNEAEKAGADFPTRDPHAAATGEDSDGEDLEEGMQEALMGGAPAGVAAGQGAGQEEGDANHPPGSQAAEGGNEAPGESDTEDSGDDDNGDEPVPGEPVPGDGEDDLASDEEVEETLSGTIPEIEAYAEQYPQTVPQLLEAEQAGRNRVTLVQRLEAMNQG